MTDNRSYLSLLIICCSILSSCAYQFQVGGRQGWVVNPSENYNHWAERMRFLINDTLLFKYSKGRDSVLVVNRDDYDKCNTETPIMKFEDGNSVFKFDRSGPFYFISGNKANCEKGQKLIIVVLAVRNRPLGPAPITITPASPPGGAGPTPISIPPASPPGGPAPSSISIPPASPPGGPAPSSTSMPPASPPGGPAPTSISMPPASPPGGPAPTSISMPPASPPGGPASMPIPSPSPSTTEAPSPSTEGSSPPAAAPGLAPSPPAPPPPPSSTSPPALTPSSTSPPGPGLPVQSPPGSGPPPPPAPSSARPAFTPPAVFVSAVSLLITLTLAACVV